MDVNDRRVYVTGGGSGIGLRLAEMLAARGAHVALFDLRLEDEALRRVEAARVEHRTPRAAAVCRRRRRRGRRGSLPPGGRRNRPARPRLQQRRHLLPERIPRHLAGRLRAGGAREPLWQPQRRGRGASAAPAGEQAGVRGLDGGGRAGLRLHRVRFLEGWRLRVSPRRCAANSLPRGIDVAVVCPPEVATPLVAWSRTVRPAPTERLTRFAGSLGLDEACQAILAGILGRSFLVIPGRRANFAYLLSRLLPKRVTHAISDRIVARALADSGESQRGPGGRAAD